MNADQKLRCQLTCHDKLDKWTHYYECPHLWAIVASACHTEVIVNPAERLHLNMTTIAGFTQLTVAHAVYNAARHECSGLTREALFDALHAEARAVVRREVLLLGALVAIAAIGGRWMLLRRR